MKDIRIANGGAKINKTANFTQKRAQKGNIDVDFSKQCYTPTELRNAVKNIKIKAKDGSVNSENLAKVFQKIGFKNNNNQFARETALYELLNDKFGILDSSYKNNYTESNVNKYVLADGTIIRHDYEKNTLTVAKPDKEPESFDLKTGEKAKTSNLDLFGINCTKEELNL